MENDPNKKESKGKRILKKALRRNSKSSNSGQGSALDQSIGVTRSKSFENKRRSLEINDSAPLPKPDGTADLAKQPPPQTAPPDQDALSDVFKSKKVEIHESHNETIEEAPVLNPNSTKQLIPPPKEQRSSAQDSVKRNLKRVGFLS